MRGCWFNSEIIGFVLPVPLNCVASNCLHVNTTCLPAVIIQFYYVVLFYRYSSVLFYICQNKAKSQLQVLQLSS